MVYLLDTNVISDLMRSATSVERWLASLSELDSVTTCTIVRGEILFGIFRLAEGKRRTDLAANARLIFETMPCESVPVEAGDHYARIKGIRFKQGLALDENDLWIAATAISLGVTLVTRDHDFIGIEGLTVLALS